LRGRAHPPGQVNVGRSAPNMSVIRPGTMSGTRAASLWRVPGACPIGFRPAPMMPSTPNGGHHPAASTKARQRPSAAWAGQVFREAISSGTCRGSGSNGVSPANPAASAAVIDNDSAGAFSASTTIGSRTAAYRLRQLLKLANGATAGTWPLGPAPAARAETFRDQEFSASDTHRQCTKGQGLRPVNHAGSRSPSAPHNWI